MTKVTTYTNPWKFLIKKAKNNAKPGKIKGNGSSREQALEVSITGEYLESLYHEQNGLCYWTGYPLDPKAQFEKYNPLALSLDRLDETRGYVPGNVVLTLRLFNLGRQTCPPEKFKQQVELIRKHFLGESVNDKLY
jgi:hypothetical protein